MHSSPHLFSRYMWNKRNRTTPHQKGKKRDKQFKTRENQVYRGFCCCKNPTFSSDIFFLYKSVFMLVLFATILKILSQVIFWWPSQAGIPVLLFFPLSLLVESQPYTWFSNKKSHHTEYHTYWPSSQCGSLHQAYNAAICMGFNMHTIIANIRRKCRHAFLSPMDLSLNLQLKWSNACAQEVHVYTREHK